MHIEIWNPKLVMSKIISITLDNEKESNQELIIT